MFAGKAKSDNFFCFYGREPLWELNANEYDMTKEKKAKTKFDLIFRYVGALFALFEQHNNTMIITTRPSKMDIAPCLK